MKSSPWPIPLLAAGLVLLVVAAWLPSIMPTAAVWTDDDAREFGRAAAVFHGAAHARGHKHGGTVHTASTGEPVSAEYAAAKADFDKQQARLDAARARVHYWKYALQAVGVALIGAGLGLYLHLRTKGESK